MLAEEWKKNFRMGKDNFYKLCGELRLFIVMKVTNMRLLVSEETQVALTLYYLSEKDDSGKQQMHLVSLEHVFL